MKYLIFCPCGHALDRHDMEGCSGDGRMPCPCPKSQDVALDAAIEHARTNPWGPPAGEAPVEAEIA
ncbi:MAG TPA: hypothetical protein VHT05_14395 [Candidatus Elarobacter sp.]|nr:hypothetical protein [Candidatus Elarobacter sp.]